MRIVYTKTLRNYMVKFIIRLLTFIGVAVLYLTNKPLMYELMTQPVWMGVTPIHLLWLGFMLMMLGHIFPIKEFPMALLKIRKQTYQEQEDYSEIELLKYVQDQNAKAWKVMLIWLSFNAIFGMLYLFEIIDITDLLMLTVFYFLCDYICILFFCPFQTGIMKNRCCVNCRIYDWGHFMMFTPMLFIKNFFSWSLFFTSIVVLIKWEITYAKHPERFYSGANKRLQCANCNDKMCQFKNAIKKN